MTLDLETRPVGTPLRLRPPERPTQGGSVPAPTTSPPDLVTPPPAPEPTVELSERVVDVTEPAAPVTLTTVSRPPVDASAEPPATSYWVRRRRAEAAAQG
jgi:hypothetical protein